MKVQELKKIYGHMKVQEKKKEAMPLNKKKRDYIWSYICPFHLPLINHTHAHLDHGCMTCLLYWVQFLILQNIWYKYAISFS